MGDIGGVDCARTSWEKSAHSKMAHTRKDKRSIWFGSVP